MAEYFTRRVLPIFLASPGDLEEERIDVSEVVQQVNRLVGRRLGWIFDLHIWEELPPSAGHPQETINKVADQSKLFIGVLWKRWGQPTKSYSSGFEEEFARAKRRWKETGEPEIWLCFKQIPQSELSDPGPQLQRVLAFRDAQKVASEFLYREFIDSADWKNKVREWLIEYALALPSREQVEVRAEAQSPVVPNVKAGLPRSTVPESVPEKAVPKQLSNLVEMLSRSVSSGDFDFVPSSEVKVTDFEVARLRLLAATWYSARVSGDLLGAHEVNFLYIRAGELRLLTEERRLIFRSLIAGADNIPGWYWFPGITGDQAEGTIVSLAAVDADTDVQRGALNLLAQLAFRPANLEWFITRALSHESYVVQLKALDYLVRVGEPADLPLLEKASEGTDSTLTYNAWVTKVSILLKGNPDSAFSELLSTDQFFPEELLAKIERVTPKISEDLLLKASDYDDVRIRRIATQELERRGKITLEKARELVKGQDVRLREVGFEALIRHGENLDPQLVKDSLKEKVREPFSELFGPFERPSPRAETIMFDLYRSHPKKKLEEEVDWYSIDGAIAYRALHSSYFSERADQLRKNLDASFDDLKADSTTKLRNRLGPYFDESTKYWRQEDVDRTIRERFTAAAMAVLAHYGEPRDIEYGRRYLADRNPAIAREAINIVERLGNRSDAQELFKIATGEGTENRFRAAQAALALLPGASEISLALAKRGELPIVRMALETIARADAGTVQENCLELLPNDNEEIRLLGVAYLLRASSDDFLRDVLIGYLSRDTYYYNVVCWLDRVLYAPEPLRTAYRNELLRRIE